MGELRVVNGKAEEKDLRGLDTLDVEEKRWSPGGPL